MPQANPYTRFIKPRKPESLPMRLWGYVAAGIVYLCYGIFWVVWQRVTRGPLGMRKRSLRYLDDL